MVGLLGRWLFNTLALWLVTQIYRGLYFVQGSQIGDYLIAGLIFGLSNALLRPVLLLLSLPLNLLTLGLFTFVVNALILLWVSSLTSLEARSFGAALIGAVLLSLVSFLLSLIFNTPKPRR